jgi:hypothetical protein
MRCGAIQNRSRKGETRYFTEFNRSNYCVRSLSQVFLGSCSRLASESEPSPIGYYYVPAAPSNTRLNSNNTKLSDLEFRASVVTLAV